ncbi:MAG TPA: hypothetical protein VFO60_01165 [Candidatus Dormibacteraeota bacterium]|nr:hypothetical protein [Candidatus Dormibacteraeota bacterium]
MTGHHAWRLRAKAFHRWLLSGIDGDRVRGPRFEALARSAIASADGTPADYLDALGWAPTSPESVEALFDTSDGIDRLPDWYAVVMGRFLDAPSAVGRQAWMLVHALPHVGWAPARVHALVYGRPLADLAVRYVGRCPLSDALAPHAHRGWLAAEDTAELHDQLSSDRPKLVEPVDRVSTILGLGGATGAAEAGARLGRAVDAMLNTLATPGLDGDCLRIATDW